MTPLISPIRPQASQGTAAPALPRLDLYTTIHKAWRQFMGDTLGRVGRMDVDDETDRLATLDQVEALLLQLRAHLDHENHFVHAAIEARRPGGAQVTAGDHEEHLESIRNLEDEAQALRQARGEQRHDLGLRLYRHLALFIAENFEHMQVEERDNNAALWALYSDAELLALHERLMASIGPAEMAATARWMAAALNPRELAELYIDVRAKAPLEAFNALLGVARSVLDDQRWAKLTRALRVPPVPGLMTV
jgi:hypothetical protein